MSSLDNERPNESIEVEREREMNERTHSCGFTENHFIPSTIVIATCQRTRDSQSISERLEDRIVFIDVCPSLEDRFTLKRKAR